MTCLGLGWIASVGIQVVTEWGKGDWWDEHWDNDGEAGLFVGGEGVGTSCMCWDVKAGG